MLYFLLEWINQEFDPAGFGVFKYITFRSAASAITALLISLIFGPLIIKRLQKMQMKEQAKTELQGVGLHLNKAGTPTMGGLIVLLSILLPTILWADLSNMFIVMVLITTAWLGVVGFLDDYLKVVKKYKKGLIGKYKLAGQVAIGAILASVIYFTPESFSPEYAELSTYTTLPFAKDYNLNFNFYGTPLLFIPFVIFVLTATSNAVNLTDGLDGLAIGTVGIASLTLALLAYVSGNVNFSDYLNIMYLRGAGEITIFVSALVGAALGFLWFNSYPAQVFMGDTGSLALGGAIGCIAILIKKEFLLPIVGGVFFAETISVIVQVTYFKYTKRKYGEGKRIFRVAPIHHHFEKVGWHESKIVSRFYIIAVILAIITLATFKVR